MNTILREGELTFTFPEDWQAEYFDVEGNVLPKHIAPVDFIVERPDDILLIEIKDPSNSKAPAKEREKFSKKMETDELTHQELVPKARTSWSYLHLMARTSKPLRYLVVIGTETLSIQPTLLQGLRDRLEKRLAQEAETAWVVKYIEDCAVVEAMQLGRYLEGVTVVRVQG
jgi:hypothetical protein